MQSVWILSEEEEKVFQKVYLQNCLFLSLKLDYWTKITMQKHGRKQTS